MGAPDLGEVRGDPWVIRSCAADLRSVIGSLGSARSAAANIESALGSSSWTGEAHAALVEQQADFPSPDDIDNAGRILERGASVLDTLAGRVEGCQERMEHCRLRLSAILVNGEVPPELEGEVDRIKGDAEEVRDDHRRALDDAAGAFDEMDDLTVYAQPPPSLMEQAGDALGSLARFTGDFVVGMVEGVVEIVKGLGQLAYYLGTPMGWMAIWENREQIGAIIRFAIDNPGEFFTTLGQAMIDWETLKENPARWLGKLVPNILLAVATGGAGAAAGRAGALASRLTRFPRAVTALNRMSRGLNAADRLGDVSRIAPGLRSATVAPGTGPVPPSPAAYSVAFETQLPSGLLGRSRSVHFNRSNAALDDALRADADFARAMDGLIPGVGPAVSRAGGRATPTGWTWHHAPTAGAQGRTGVLQLVPTPQHAPGSAWQDLLHPDGAGGYAEWAIPAGAPTN